MPQSLNIAIFVFGAVLVLIGLLGGKFKLFVAEVSGTVGAGPRIASLIFGCGLIAWGLSSEARSTASAPTEVAPRRDIAAHSEPSVTQVEHPAPIVRPEPTPAIDLSGSWQDEAGNVYEVTSLGNSFEFHSRNAATGMSAEGRVTLHGLNWESSYRTSYAATGVGNGIISADGNRMMGSYTDTRYGAYSHTIIRFK